MTLLLAKPQSHIYPHRAPMTLGSKLNAMDALACSAGREVPTDVWSGVLNVYHSYNMTVSHLPHLPPDMRSPVELKSKPRVLTEIRERLNHDAYRVAKYESSDSLKQADIHLVLNRLHDMVERRVILHEPADALISSAALLGVQPSHKGTRLRSLSVKDGIGAFFIFAFAAVSCLGLKMTANHILGGGSQNVAVSTIFTLLLSGPGLLFLGDALLNFVFFKEFIAMTSRQ